MKDQAEEIESFAGKLMSCQEVALITGIPEKDITTSEHPAGKAYLRGILKAKAKIQESIVRLATQGSAPAQTLALKMQRAIEMQNMIEV